MDLRTQYQGSWFIHTDLCLRAGAGWLIPAGTDCQWIECHNIYCVQFDIQYTLGDVFSFLNFICCRNDSARVPIGMRKLPVYVLCVLGCLWCLLLLLLLWLLRSSGHKSWRRSTGIFPRWMDIEPLVSRLFVRESITAHTHTPVAFHSTFYIRKKNNASVKSLAVVCSCYLFNLLHVLAFSLSLSLTRPALNII